MTRTSGSAFRIATMGANDVAFAIGLAADEGWNPGLHDAATFHAADPDGFLIGHLGDQPIGCISAVSYGHFGFVGLYIVAPPWRGQGYGIQLWRAGMHRLAGQPVGLDGVFAQQANYRRSGFAFAYSNLRFEQVGARPPPSDPCVRALRETAIDDVLAYDARHFGGARPAFLRRWLDQPDSVALGYIEQGRLRGYGVIRRCRRGHKVGPLLAESPAIAEQLYLGLCAHAADDEPVFLDVPEVNPDARALADRYGMLEVFGTARMYVGPAPVLPVGHIYGVTTFELG